MLDTLLYRVRMTVAGLRNARGQTMPEYAILLGIIALLVLAAALLLSGQISSALGGAATSA